MCIRILLDLLDRLGEQLAANSVGCRLVMREARIYL